MSQKKQVEECKKDWLMANLLATGSRIALRLDEEIEASERENLVGVYDYEDGKVIAKSGTKQEYYYSEVWIDADEVH